MFQRIFAAVAVLFTGKLPTPRPVAAAGAPASGRNWLADKSAVSALLADSRFRFRSLSALSAGLGLAYVPGSLDANYVKELAIAAGARAEYRNPELFGLKERVGETGRRVSTPQPAPAPLADISDDDKSAVSALLSDSRFRFRSLSAMSKAIGKDTEHTRRVAVAVGARPEYRNQNLYGLISRVGETGRRNPSGWDTVGTSNDDDDSDDDDDFGGE